MDLLSGSAVRMHRVAADMSWRSVHWCCMSHFGQVPAICMGVPGVLRSTLWAVSLLLSKPQKQHMLSAQVHRGRAEAPLGPVSQLQLSIASWSHA
jgi:hypothetical protein